MAEETDPLHLGNVITILSDKYGLITGRIMYRDLSMVRLVSQDASDRAIEFPLTIDGSKFIPELGVTDIEIIETQASDYFVDTLGAKVGETLEFFSLDGIEAGANGVIAEIIKSPTKDSIRLEDGRVLKFRGKGPELPIAVIRVTASPAEQEQEKDQGQEKIQEQIEDLRPGIDVLALLRSVLPAATVEVIPTAERTFPDSMQREDMFQDLVADIPAKQRTNPRRIRFVEREVDLALALKNRSLLRDGTGRSLGPNMQSLRSLKEVAAASPAPAAIPIVKAAKILNLDGIAGAFKDSDVYPRSLAHLESDSEMLANIYLNGAGEYVGSIAEKAKGLGFFSYMYDLFDRDGRTLIGETGPGWSEDQDVIRTAGLGSPVQGLSSKITVDAEATPAFLLSDVTNRSMRVLTSDVYTNLKTQMRNLVAPTDPSDVIGYVILPIKAALALRPPRRSGDLPTALIYSASLDQDNLPTLAKALRDLYSEEADPLHAWTLNEKDHEVADWLKIVLPYAVHPGNSLGPRTSSLLSILDSLGLGATDLAPPVYAVVHDWVAQSQNTWRTLLKEKRAAVQALIDGEVARTFDPIAGSDSLLFVPASEKRATALQGLFDGFAKRNPALSGSWSMIAASLLIESQGDGLPLLWSYIQKADGLDSTIDEMNASAALAASQMSSEKRKALRDIDLLALKAAPEVSTCPHVERLEAVRNINDILDKSRLLRDFIETYQGPKSGDWMTCALCTGGCVCYHEIMELEALAQPSRLESIQKQILVRFGGARYEGKIVCKNCGLPLQDIDYDEHVEFDDHGHAITGRSILTEEQLADVTDGIRLATPAALTFASQSQREIAEALQIIVDRAGIRMPEAVTRRIVRHVDIYVSARAPPPALYETQRAKAMTSAATKIKATTGTQVATIDVPTYAAVLDQLRVTALTGLVALALQTTEPPLEVTTPFPLCDFSRGGWPFDPEAPKDGTPDDRGVKKSAVVYMSCVVASIQRDLTPWRNLAWAGLPKLESRRVAVLKAVVSALSIIVMGDPKTGPLTFGPEIRTELLRAQTDVAAVAQRALVSRGDSMTHGFRPEAFPQKVARPAIEKNPLPNVIAAINAGTSAALGTQIATASRQMARALIVEMHEEASSVKVSNTTEAVCCPIPIQEAATGSLVIQSPGLAAAATELRAANPALPQGGSRLWQTNTESVAPEVVPVVEEGIYFKLFLRFCYQGPQIGLPHEFSVGNVCRQCGLRLGKSPDLINFDKEGAGILSSQEGELRIEITAAAFEGLSTTVRRKKHLTPPVLAVAESWKVGLKELAKMMTHPEYVVFGEALNTILDSNLPDDEMARATAWAPIAVLHDELKAQVIDRVGPLVPRQPGKAGEQRAREAVRAMDAFDSATEDPFVEGPRTLLEYWCTKVSAAGRGFGIVSVAGAKWFKISREHNERIDKLLRENSQWFSGDLPPACLPVLVKVSETLAPLLRLWITAVRPGSWTVTEAQLVLRTLVFHVWRDAVSTTSWLYNDIAVPADRELVAATLANWTRALMLHMRQQVFKYSKETIKQVLQQRAELERTSVVKEFEDIRDDDVRAAELIKKSFRIGRWGVGKNLQKYDADLFEFESEQRLRMGIADAPVDPLLVEAAAPVADFGLGADAGPEAGYDVDQDTADNA